MTPDRIAELRALAEKATPGPWEAMTFSTDMVNSYAPSNRGYVVVRDATKNTQRSDSDVAFIAAARTALPEALDEVARLQTILCRIEDLAHAGAWYDFPVNDLLKLVDESGPWEIT